MHPGQAAGYHGVGISLQGMFAPKAQRTTYVSPEEFCALEEHQRTLVCSQFEWDSFQQTAQGVFSLYKKRIRFLSSDFKFK